MDNGRRPEGAHSFPFALEGPGKIVGRRVSRQSLGFWQMEGFAELLNDLRGVDIMRPRGVFRFRSFEEADAWWEESLTVRLQKAEPQPSET
ncbi:MAG: hypothetical protein M0Z66_01995 [Thermaerobacter sp.]|nr:hypothetical protein [Thermaerobacter sp.]